MTDLVPTNDLSVRMHYAKALASSNLLPGAYRQNPANVLVAIEYGTALGLAPMIAIQSIHVVDGKPTASAQLIGSLVRRAGHRLRVTGDAKRAVAEIVRADDPEYVFRSEWTIERATQANLAGKGVWKQYPDAMLKARAITEVARDACPEVLAGVAYTAEELGADEVASPVPFVDSTPLPSEPVVELEVVDVDEATGEITGSHFEEAQPLDPPGTGNRVAAHQLASDKQLKLITDSIEKLSKELNFPVPAIGELDILSTIIGHDLEAISDLGKYEASRIIEDIMKGKSVEMRKAFARYITAANAAKQQTTEEEPPADLW